MSICRRYMKGIYNNDVINAITNIVLERRYSFNNTYYGTSLV